MFFWLLYNFGVNGDNELFIFFYYMIWRYKYIFLCRKNELYKVILLYLERLEIYEGKYLI